MARGRKSKSRSRKSSSRKARKSIRRARGKRCWSGGANQLVFPAPVENASYESSFSSPSKMMLSQGNEYQSLHAGQHGGAVAMNLAPAPPGYTGVLEDGLRGQAAISPIDQSLKAIVGMSDQAGGARRRRRGTKRSKRSKRGTKRSKRGTRGRKLMGGGKGNSNSQKASSAAGSPNTRKASSAAGSPNTRKASTAVAPPANMKKLAATAQANMSKLAASQAKPSANPGNLSKLAATAQSNLSKLSEVVKTNLSKLTTAVGQGGGAAVSLANAQNFGAPAMLLSPGQEAAALGGMNPEWKLAMDPASFAPNLSK